MSTIVYLLACGVITYGGFCRLVHTDLTTELCIRAVFWMLTSAAAANFAAVLVWSYTPGWPAALLASAIAAVQTATALLWRRGVPPPYQTQRPNQSQ